MDQIQKLRELMNRTKIYQKTLELVFFYYKFRSFGIAKRFENSHPFIFFRMPFLKKKYHINIWGICNKCEFNCQSPTIFEISFSCHSEQRHSCGSMHWGQSVFITRSTHSINCVCRWLWNIAGLFLPWIMGI